eukprot:TRINITY_DN11335_c0_g1_i3.p1 TRINITY_DN11335_c0_g1~~TRINITY_DN11335_c0_g1_i3.p1  ORF type:complete len:437 (+),score=132.49 TRINITY_DN11335_c0_g1_i3:86-1396(+)
MRGCGQLADPELLRLFAEQLRGTRRRLSAADRRAGNIQRAAAAASEEEAQLRKKLQEKLEQAFAAKVQAEAAMEQAEAQVAALRGRAEAAELQLAAEQQRAVQLGAERDAERAMRNVLEREVRANYQGHKEVHRLHKDSRAALRGLLRLAEQGHGLPRFSEVLPEGPESPESDLSATEHQGTACQPTLEHIAEPDSAPAPASPRSPRPLPPPPEPALEPAAQPQPARRPLRPPSGSPVPAAAQLPRRRQGMVRPPQCESGELTGARHSGDSAGRAGGGLSREAAAAPAPPRCPSPTPEAGDLLGPPIRGPWSMVQVELGPRPRQETPRPAERTARPGPSGGVAGQGGAKGGVGGSPPEPCAAPLRTQASSMCAAAGRRWRSAASSLAAAAAAAASALPTTVPAGQQTGYPPEDEAGGGAAAPDTDDEYVLVGTGGQ